MASTNVKWTSEHINHLLHSMKGFRPYGVDKHFHMMFIVERFRSRSGLNVTADPLWGYIEELYDTKTLGKEGLERLRNKSIEYSLPLN